MRGNIIKKRLMSFAFEKTPRISLTCKLVPVQYREYENSLLAHLEYHTAGVSINARSFSTNRKSDMELDG